jgi:hypothetical protein
MMMYGSVDVWMYACMHYIHATYLIYVLEENVCADYVYVTHLYKHASTKVGKDRARYSHTAQDPTETLSCEGLRLT